MGEIREPNKHGYPSSPKMVVFIKHNIYGRKFLLMPQDDDHKFWVHIITIIDDHETKVAHDPGHIKFINSINNDQYEKVISCNNIANHILKMGMQKLCGKPKSSLQMKNQLLYPTLITKDLGTMLQFNER